jgi:hypothetical protein
MGDAQAKLTACGWLGFAPGAIIQDQAEGLLRPV